MSYLSGKRSLWAEDVGVLTPADSFSVRYSKRPAHGYHAPSLVSDPPTEISRSSQEGGEPVSASSYASSISAEGIQIEYRNMFGRRFGQSEHYMLPVDDNEQLRQNMQHNALRLHLNGSLYVCEDLVRHALRPGQVEQPAILDVGCGPGQWAIDMAREFPHADVLGQDIALPLLASNPNNPENVRFEVDDANLDMVHFNQAFNVIHIRSVEAGINDFEAYLYRVAAMLRPGGVLLLVSGGPQLYDKNYQPLPVTEPGEPGFTWLQFFLHVAYDAFLHRGTTSVDANLHWHGWLKNNPNYKDVVNVDTWLPLVHWDPNMTDRQVLVSKMKRESINNILEAYIPLLRSDGQSTEDINYWIQETRKELQEERIPGQICWRYTTAIRTDGELQEQLEMPTPVEPSKARLIVAPTWKGDKSPASVASAGSGSSGSGSSTASLG